MHNISIYLFKNQELSKLNYLKWKSMSVVKVESKVVITIKVTQIGKGSIWLKKDKWRWVGGNVLFLVIYAHLIHVIFHAKVKKKGLFIIFEFFFK